MPLAYTHINNLYSVAVAKFKVSDGGAWENIGHVSVNNKVHGIRLIFDANNMPYIVSEIGNALGLIVLDVTKFNGSAWEKVAEDYVLTMRDTTVSSVAFDLNNVPYIAYSDYLENGLLKVVKLSDDGIYWENVSEQSVSDREVDHVSLAINRFDTLYIAYTENNASGRVRVMKFENSRWETVGIDDGFASTGGVSYLSLSLTGGGITVPYVAYTDLANSNKATVMYLN